MAEHIAFAIALVIIIFQRYTIEMLKHKLKIEKTLNKAIFPQHKELPEQWQSHIIRKQI